MEARNNYAVMLDNGLGVAADPTGAMKLFSESASAGEIRAQVNLGKKLASDPSSPENILRAYAWLNVASSSGDSEAKALKSMVAARLNAEQLREAQRLSRSLVPAG
jgi:TPR repeat protein